METKEIYQTHVDSAEAARMIGYHRLYLHRLIREGKAEAKRIPYPGGFKYMLSLKEVKRLQQRKAVTKRGPKPKVNAGA